MDIKLAYGIREGRVVHISELTPTENGEKCNCTCPVCGKTLVAKLGGIRQWHFAHKCDYDIAYAQETGLHKLAKEIIRENRRILVPGLTFSWNEIALNGINDLIADEMGIQLPNMSSCTVDYDSVEIEKPIGNIVADAVIRVKGITCIVEVAVTHFIDEIKTKKLKEIGHSAFEIDLRDLLESSPTRDEIVAKVLSDETNRYWIFNPKKEQLLTKFRDKCAVEIRNREIEETKKQLKWMNPKNYAYELKRLRNDELAAEKLKGFDFYKELPSYPFYMDIPVTGESVFSCDRRIWQGKLFDDYVYYIGFEFFSISEIKNRIITEKMMLQYDPQKQQSSFSYAVVQRYFDYLELLGFVYHKGNRWYSKRPVSLAPPNSQAASILSDILKSVDCSSPNIDQIINGELLSRLGDNDKKLVLKWSKRKKHHTLF